MHPILEAYARLGGSTAAERMLQEMIGGRHAAPDAKCFELLAQVTQKIVLSHTSCKLICNVFFKTRLAAFALC